MNDKHLKINFLLILKNQILLYLWAKYNPIWPAFTGQTVILVLVFWSEQARHYTLLFWQ